MAETELALGLGSSSNLNNTLNSFKANASFVWDHTYSVGFGYFNIAGSGDCNVYGRRPAVACPTALALQQQLHRSPNGDGLILDSPTSLQPRRAVSLFDLERAARPAVHRLPAPLRRHDQFRRLELGNTHNAQGNNSVFAYAWFAF